MKTIFLNCALLLSFHLKAQSNLSQDHLVLSSASAVVNESGTVLPEAPGRKFADYFMKKATIIDASGNIIVGRANILLWQDQQAKKGQPAARACKITESVIRQIRPDLTIVLAKTIGDSGGASYDILWRRIDGKWYVESCTIVAAGNQSGTAMVGLQPDLLNLAER